MKKIITVTELVAVISLITCINALAGTWVEGFYGNWDYLNDDGTKAANQWVESNGSWYYIGRYGDMARSEVTPDGYIVKKDGAWSGEKFSLYEEMDEEVSDAYCGLLQNFSNLYSYCLIDSDGDGTPELFVENGTCQAEMQWDIFKWDGDKAVWTGSQGGGNASICIDRHHNLYEAFCHMGYMIVYRMDDHSNAIYKTELKGEEDYADKLDPLGIYYVPRYWNDDFSPFE